VVRRGKKGGRLDEALKIIEELLTNREAYFDKRGYLNSEGLKLAVRATRIIVEHLPAYSWMLGDVKSKRDYETIAKILRELENILEEGGAGSLR